jgi:hypothetical protein
MPDASRHCKRLALEIGARWSSEALRGHPTSAEPRRPRALRSRPSVQERRKAKLKPGKPAPPGPSAKTCAFQGRGRGCDSWKAKTRPRPRWMPSVHSPQYRDRLGSATIVAGLRCAASAREPPSSPKHRFNPPRAVATLPALDQEPYASPARTRTLSIPM